jgi:predicted nucleic acid-binding Zn ribbon protein
MSDAQSRRPGSNKRRATSKAPANAGGPQTLGSALSQLFALKGYANEQGNAQLSDCWKHVAGERIASRTAVLGVHRGVLQVAVSSAAMMGELASFHKQQLIEELQTRYPDLKLKGIKFRLRGDLQKESKTPANHANGRE